jgi:DNA-binding HxlR family transcriptional regulator
VPEITEGMLSARLQELREAGIVRHEVLEGPPLTTVYRLTERGMWLEPALMALARWAQSNLWPRFPAWASG